MGCCGYRSGDGQRGDDVALFRVRILVLGGAIVRRQQRCGECEERREQDGRRVEEGDQAVMRPGAVAQPRGREQKQRTCHDREGQQEDG